MKKLLLFALLSSCISVEAQTSVYHPFPDSNAVWRVGWGAASCAQFNYPQAQYQYEIDGDTMIGTYPYKKVIRIYGVGFFICWPDYLQGGGYMGGFRQDTITRKIFFVPKDSIQETLLYDFNLLVGDTVRGMFLEVLVGNNLIVTDIDSILIGSTYRKRFKCEGAYPLHVNYLVEGIGNITSGLLEPPEMMDLTPLLVCFKQDGVQLYPSSPISYCDLPNSINIISEEKFSFTISPNPVHDFITIKNNQQKELIITIFSSIGEVVQKTTLGKDVVTTINLSGLAAGIYMVTALSEQNFTVRKIIKE
ncbi:MAG: T9SS type A sorting domain-containing protein [Bacteroidia bacterium]|nr:T9SS type A sorting domain-containing protein [Bacteroidia bacterium]